MPRWSLGCLQVVKGPRLVGRATLTVTHAVELSGNPVGHFQACGPDVSVDELTCILGPGAWIIGLSLKSSTDPTARKSPATSSLGAWV